jgi:pyrimidine-nucleoside phosphorylase
MTSPVELILKKRAGRALAPEEIDELVAGVASGEIPDYQLSAFLMAVFFRGMSDRETVALTRAMLHTGRVIPLRSVRAPKIDKHSTGGVGDKISLCLGPLVAAAGVAVPMISGRGLGHTGGTLDKLEAIPGYRVDLGVKQFERVLRDVGVSLIGQTAELAPVDRKIYAIRDVTGTVESIPLIVASILSKKLALGSDGLVLDVKAGRGAFMPDLERARILARALVSVGRRAGKRVVALVTDMSSPIGLSIGNGLETREAIEVLRGAGPRDTRELTLALGVEMLLLAGAAKTAGAARSTLERALDDGSAFERFRRMVHAHGGDTRSVDRPERLTNARFKLPILSSTSGFVAAIDPLALGLASIGLGAGRTRAEQTVDPAAGIEISAPLGARVTRKEPLAYLYARTRTLAEAEAKRVHAAFTIAARRRPHGDRVLDHIRSRTKS